MNDDLTTWDAFYAAHADTVPVAELNALDDAMHAATRTQPASISFWVDGTPVAKQSFRVGNGHGYQRQAVLDWQERVGYVAKERMGGREMFAGNVVLTLRFYMANKRRVDIDNLQKAICDSLKGVMFADDSQVVEIHAYKTVRKDAPAVYACVTDEALQMAMDETR